MSEPVTTIANSQLRRELEELRGRDLFPQLHDQPDGWVFVVFEGYSLPAGLYNQMSTDVLVKVPPAYPVAGLDMFWCDPGLRLANAGLPANTTIEQPLGRDWLRFSWHPAAWRPGQDNLIGYLAFVDQRLAAGN